MAKRASSEQLSVSKDQLPVASEQEYAVGEWAGMDHYRCLKCPFDTLDKAVMLEHQLNQHKSKASQIEITEPAIMSPSTSSGETPLSAQDDPGQGIYEIDLKEDQHG